eukprot:TRINITY_DN30739_c0_g1_i1.p1 TRINITY_DN30739_c0_g1~~TRINITY_DN30739_c0_g1_i1.p1  ORF type:complete len:359 (+),score=99.76 TRINITY_DN30739_c0_g1_i1:87-1163(+)
MDQSWIKVPPEPSIGTSDDTMKNTLEFRALFADAAEREVVLQCYGCSLDSVKNQGQLYITSANRLCFFSAGRIFDEVKRSVPFKSVASIEKVDGLLSTGIDITLVESPLNRSASVDVSQQPPAKLQFRNFFNSRDQCFDTLQSVWKAYKTRPLVFGEHLSVLLFREKPPDGIPQFVRNAVDFIRANLLDLQGIFRMSASISGMARVQDLIDQGSIPNFADVSITQGDPHLVPCLLKKFFSLLPDSLFPAEEYLCFVTMRHIIYSTDSSRSEILKKFRDMMLLMPEENRRLAAYMVEFLAEVAAHSASNRMGMQNLATVWGPNLIRSPVGEQSIEEVGFVNEMFAIIVENHQTIFENVL